MSQQTAVEELYNDLFPKKLDGFSDEEWSKIDKAFEQAKEMEKLEKERCWIAALEYGLKVLKTDENANSKEAFEQYYKETYKKD